MGHEDDEGLRAEKSAWIKLTGSLTLVLVGYQILQEVTAFHGAETWRDHFDSVWNWNDAFWMTLTPIIILFAMPTQFWIPKEVLATMAAMASFSMMIKILLDWMRLFDKTAFYIDLIG